MATLIIGTWRTSSTTVRFAVLTATAAAVTDSYVLPLRLDTSAANESCHATAGTTAARTVNTEAQAEEILRAISTSFELG